MFAASEPSVEGWVGASWDTLAFVVLSSLLIYAAALAVIRVSGRKTVAQMAAPDFVVTVALGTIVGSTAVSWNPSFANGISGIIILVALQQVVAFARRKWPPLGRFVDFTPRVAIWNGELFQKALAKSGMAESALLSKLRMHGVRHLNEVQAAIIESTGEVSVLNRLCRPGLRTTVGIRT